MLTHAKVKALETPGRHGDGGGLYLNVAKGGSKSWVQRIAIDGRRRDVGLGGFPAVSLAKARERASQNRDAIADGRDPVAEKRTPQPAMPTFREAARACHEIHRPRWRMRSTPQTGWLRSNATPCPSWGSCPLTA